MGWDMEMIGSVWRVICCVRTLTFHDKEEDDQRADEITRSEDVAVAEVDGAGDERSEEGEQEIPQLEKHTVSNHAQMMVIGGSKLDRVSMTYPVGCGGESHALGSVAGWVQLTANRPEKLCQCLLGIGSKLPTRSWVPKWWRSRK
jgi:hypothetical protein